MNTVSSLAALGCFLAWPRRAVFGLCEAGLTVLLLFALIGFAFVQLLGAGVAQSRFYRWLSE